MEFPPTKATLPPMASSTRTDTGRGHQKEISKARKASWQQRLQGGLEDPLLDQDSAGGLGQAARPCMLSLLCAAHASRHILNRLNCLKNSSIFTFSHISTVCRE